MKMKQLYLTFISACLLLAAGCREEEGEFKPSTLTLNTPEVTVAADGGEVSVSYRLASPVYEGRITVGNVPEWISGVSTSLSGVISFTVAANELTESRSAELSVRYSGDAETAVLRVVQSPRTVPPVFDIRMELITQTSAKYSVIPGDKEQTYLSMLVEKDYFDSYASDEEYFQDDLAYIRAMAESFGVSVQEYLSNTLNRGDLLVKNMTGLLPGTAYYVYAYGLTVDGERTTDIYKVEFETVAVPKIDVTFTVDATVNGPLCDLHIVPSDPNQRYVIGMYVADQVQDGEDACRQYQQYLSDMIVIYEAMGMTAEETVAGLSVVGTTDRTYELEENTGYLVFAASCTDDGLINSDPVSTTFRTTEVQPSDNRISFEVTSLEAHAATIDVKTENFDPYVLYLVNTSAVEGMDDEAVISSLLADETIADYLRRGDTSFEASELEASTSYTLLAFGYVKGKATTGLFSVEFTTEDGIPADISILVEHDRYFDGTQIAELYPDDYADAYGLAVLPLTVTTQGDPAERVLYYIYEGDLTSDFILPDNEAIAALLRDGISQESVSFFLPYDDESTLLAFAIGADGNYSPVYREKIVLTEEGVSPVEDFRPFALTRSAMECRVGAQQESVRRKPVLTPGGERPVLLKAGAPSRAAASPRVGR
ncbi:BACON domain-containing protein [uncultured Alistipes sp.]|uniref:BACON domain-containing protein n=1 Tax=uncultured Alistipes sp. TaxID=538949 RepID=UPI002805178F|nr:BACON domain-containing carbohydrate-binding protein [uncultured Alistipes sp.]